MALVNKLITNLLESKTPGNLYTWMFQNFISNVLPLVDYTGYLTDFSSGSSPGNVLRGYDLGLVSQSPYTNPVIDGSGGPGMNAWHNFGSPVIMSGFLDVANDPKGNKIFISSGRPVSSGDFINELNKINVSKSKPITSLKFINMNDPKQGTNGKTCSKPSDCTAPYSNCSAGNCFAGESSHGRDHTKMYWTDNDVVISSGHPYLGSSQDMSGINEEILLENAPAFAKYLTSIFSAFWETSQMASELGWTGLSPSNLSCKEKITIPQTLPEDHKFNIV